MDQLTPYLDRLSDSLGVGIDQLFESLMQQARIAGTWNILWTLAAATGLYATLRWRRRSEPAYDDGEEAYRMVAYVVALVALCIIALLASYWAATCFANPEYYAIHEILSSLGGE